MAYSWHAYNTNEAHLSSGYSNPDQWPWMDRMYIRNGRTPLYRTMFNQYTWENPTPDPPPFNRPTKSWRDPTMFDDLVRQATTRGISLVPILVNRSHVDNRVYYPDISGWRAFCSYLVNRYGQNGTFYAQEGLTGPRIRFWEIWNEPNTIVSYVAPGPYATLLAESALRIRAGDPNAKIIFGGVAVKRPETFDGENAGSTEGDVYVHQVHGASSVIHNYYDHVGVHYYPRSSDPVNTCVTNTLNAMMAVGGEVWGLDPSKRIWLGEFSVTRRLSEKNLQFPYVHHTDYSYNMCGNLHAAIYYQRKFGPFAWWPLGDAPLPATGRARENGLIAAKDARDQNGIPTPYTPAYYAWYKWDDWAQSTANAAFAG